MDWIQISPSIVRRFPPSRRYLVGVSGGRDSVALLHWLVDLGYKNLIVCHLNHQLRGRSSDADARFVENLATKYGLEIAIGTANIRSLAVKKKMSIETAAREARYAFFGRTARRKRCHTIFLAHHADDLVETFLINLFRGAGTTGLSAIREISTCKIEHVDLKIVRPLLGTWRRDIQLYVREHRVKFREDASNKDLATLRNRIRRRIIPYLEKAVGRNIRQSIWRAAMIAAEDENWMEQQLPNARRVELASARLRELPVALQRREILKWLRGQHIADVGFDIVESVRSLLDQQSRIAKVNLSQDRHVRRRAGKIFVE
jgi:tRNA(Ile)-lysidine synthase